MDAPNRHRSIQVTSEGISRLAAPPEVILARFYFITEVTPSV